MTPILRSKIDYQSTPCHIQLYITNNEIMLQIIESQHRFSTKKQCSNTKELGHESLLLYLIYIDRFQSTIPQYFRSSFVSIFIFISTIYLRPLLYYQTSPSISNNQHHISYTFLSLFIFSYFSILDKSSSKFSLQFVLCSQPSSVLDLTLPVEQSSQPLKD